MTELLLRKELWAEKRGFSVTDTPSLDCSSQREFLGAWSAVLPCVLFSFLRGLGCRACENRAVQGWVHILGSWLTIDSPL